MECKVVHSKVKLKRKHDVLLILGDGATMPEDLTEFLSWHIKHDTAALGRAIKEYPGHVQHWFNADGESAIHWAKNLPNGGGTIRHTMGEIDGFDVDWEMIQPDYHYEEITGEKGRQHGSSALFATLAAIAMGYESIVLAGCPLDTEGHYYFDEQYRGPLWFGLDYMAWLDFAEQPESRNVVSLSGYTKKILSNYRRSVK